MPRMKLLDTPKIPNDVAFAPRRRERSIPIDYDACDFEFTKRWFRGRNQCTFSTFLPGRFAGKRTRMIQIGVYEGMDLVWCCQNILTHPDACALAVDPWAATRKQPQPRMDEVALRAHANLHLWRKKVKLIRGYSDHVLSNLTEVPVAINGQIIPAGCWDLIVVDGDHNADPVYNDAVLSLQLVRVGGWILFDDVRNRFKKKNHVADGLRGWLLEYGSSVKLAWYHRHMNCYERIK